MSGTKLISLGGGSVEVNNYYEEVVDSTGFVNPDDSQISFDDGTRTFTIEPTDTSFVFYAFGIRYEKTAAETEQIDDVDGLWYIYYDGDGVLGSSQTIWDLSTQVPVATVLWDTGAGDVGDSKDKSKDTKFLDIYIIGISSPGTFENDQLIAIHTVAGSEIIELRKQLPYSIIKCRVAPTGNISFDIQVNQVSKGSAEIDAAATTGSFTWNNKVTLNGGDIIEIFAPDTADGTLETVAMTLEGIRI